MIKFGTIVDIDYSTYTGIIQDEKGKEFFFSQKDCHNFRIPKLSSRVTFDRDPDFRTTDVAIFVRPALN